MSGKYDPTKLEVFKDNSNSLNFFNSPSTRNGKREPALTCLTLLSLSHTPNQSHTISHCFPLFCPLQNCIALIPQPPLSSNSHSLTITLSFPSSLAPSLCSKKLI